MKVTVQTVAERAQVSVGTVSRVINRDPTVSAGLSTRVRRCIDELGYVPLRKRKSKSPNAEHGIGGKVIGLLTLGMDRSLSRLPVVTAAIDGIREAASAAGANLQWFDAPDPGAQPDWLKHAHCDAWLIKGAMQGNAWTAAHPVLRARLAGAPCIWFHGRPRGAPGWSVSANDWDAGGLAAAHLYSRGHRRVGFLSPKNNHGLLKQRQLGFVAACEELGMDCQLASRNLQSWTFPLERPKSLAAVSSLLGELMDAGAAVPSAIFVPADSIAVLLYRALAERGLAVPDDVSVVSVNREEGLTAGLYPGLTTIDIRSEAVGRASVEQLQKMLAADGSLPPEHLQLEPELVDGESVKTL